MELKVTPWEDEEPLTEEVVRDHLQSQELRVYHWSSAADDTFAGHTHGYHKILYVLEGEIKFEFPTRHKTLNLTSGDRLDLPAGIRHSATVGPDGVKCLESHMY